MCSDQTQGSSRESELCGEPTVSSGVKEWVSSGNNWISEGRIRRGDHETPEENNKYEEIFDADERAFSNEKDRVPRHDVGPMERKGWIDLVVIFVFVQLLAGDRAKHHQRS